MGDGSPALSIGLAVRNGLGVVERCLDSVLRQDFTDLEVVICDNVSDDGTPELLAERARSDPRIAVHVNAVNIGSHENMNRVLELARGTFFRWISADDWLEPGCLSAAVAALRERPDAVGVTTGFTIHTDDGATRFEDFPGPYPDAPDPAERLDRMLWFFHAGDAKYDPIYGTYRREAMVRSHRLRPSERTDWLLSAELALLGPILHLPARLANRSRSYPVGTDRAAFRRRLDPARGDQLKTGPRRMMRELYALAVCADLEPAQLRRARRSIARFGTKEAIRVTRSAAADTRARALRRNG